MFAGLLCLPVSAFARDLEFRLINSSDAPLIGFHVTDTKDDKMTGNLLAEGQIIAPGATGSVFIEDGEAYCEYDIRGVFDYGEDHDDYIETINYQVDLCALGEWTFTE